MTAVLALALFGVWRRWRWGAYLIFARLAFTIGVQVFVYHSLNWQLVRPKTGSIAPTHNMAIYYWLILALWLALIAYWVISAGSATRNIGGGWMWSREIALRLGVLVCVLLALRISVFRHALANARSYAVNTNMLMGIIGAALCALGVGLAVVARVYLGRNWGMPMSRKRNPELVTAGPYAFVRHPIYTGFLLAMLGSTIGQSIFWLLPLILSGPYFIYSARREEKMMTEKFPEQYPAYMKRTKMLLPFVL